MRFISLLSYRNATIHDWKDTEQLCFTENVRPSNHVFFETRDVQDLKLYKECISYEILLLPRILLFFLLDISLRITLKKLKIVQTTESYELFQLLE